jgi:hypothetical protein
MPVITEGNAYQRLFKQRFRNVEVEGSTPFRSTFVKPCRNKSFCCLSAFGRAAFSCRANGVCQLAAPKCEGTASCRNSLERLRNKALSILLSLSAEPNSDQQRSKRQQQ